MSDETRIQTILDDDRAIPESYGRPRKKRPFRLVLVSRRSSLTGSRHTIAMSLGSRFTSVTTSSIGYQRAR